ncbi:hypothetical protein [Streptomyces yanii]|uniref:Uncharacterized protein n=1 Tax=Streptomyces yanii TaxID=78510 RepID=A0ABV5R728_9ACTN
MCGITCPRMALLARSGDAPTMFELLDGARKCGAYTEDAHIGEIRGLIYALFVQYVDDQTRARGPDPAVRAQAGATMVVCRP